MSKKNLKYLGSIIANDGRVSSELVTRLELACVRTEKTEWLLGMLSQESPWDCVSVLFASCQRHSFETGGCKSCSTMLKERQETYLENGVTGHRSIDVGNFFLQHMGHIVGSLVHGELGQPGQHGLTRPLSRSDIANCLFYVPTCQADSRHTAYPRPYLYFQDGPQATNEGSERRHEGSAHENRLFACGHSFSLIT